VATGGDAIFCRCKPVLVLCDELPRRLRREIELAALVGGRPPRLRWHVPAAWVVLGCCLAVLVLAFR
jgi:hypothetical protein